MVRISQGKLAAAMLANGVDVSTLSRGANLNISRVSRLMNYGGNCRNSTVFRLAKSLGTSPHSLLIEDDADGADDATDTVDDWKKCRAQSKDAMFAMYKELKANQNRYKVGENNAP